MTTNPHPHYSTEDGEVARDKPTYYKLHKAKCDSAHKKWLAKNREKWNAYMRERRAHGK